MDQRIRTLFDEFTHGRISKAELSKQLEQLTGNPDPRPAFMAIVAEDNAELLRLHLERTQGLPDGPVVPSTVYANFMALAATIPGLAAEWEAHLRTEYPGFSVEQLSDACDGFSYTDTGVFSEKVVTLLTRGDTAPLAAFFEQVDFMLFCDDHRTEELTGMGLLEGLQNRLIESPFSHHTGLDAWLQPSTKQFWDNLNDSWEGPAAKQFWDDIMGHPE